MRSQCSLASAIFYFILSYIAGFLSAWYLIPHFSNLVLDSTGTISGHIALPSILPIESRQNENIVVQELASANNGLLPENKRLSSAAIITPVVAMTASDASAKSLTKTFSKSNGGVSSVFKVA